MKLHKPDRIPEWKPRPCQGRGFSVAPRWRSAAARSRTGWNGKDNTLPCGYPWGSGKTPHQINGEVWPSPCRELARKSGAAWRNWPWLRQGVNHPPPGSNLVNGLGGVSTALPWPFIPRSDLGRTPGGERENVSRCPAPRGSASTVWSALPGPTMPRRPPPRRS